MHLADETDAAEEEELSTDDVAIIFGFLSYQDIMRARVCTTWRDAAKKTIVPPSEFVVESEKSYNAMRVMATSLPNLQQISISPFNKGGKRRRISGHGHKFIDGEDADGWTAAKTATWTTFDINIISNFRKLRSLKIEDAVSLNGRYPVLFNFAFLQTLTISRYSYFSSSMKWDLNMLVGCPSLKVLQCDVDGNLTGNLKSLRVLKDTLEEVLVRCGSIRGNFIDLADFPRLKVLHLDGTNVTGDIRDIHGHDFPTLESLKLPMFVHGGVKYKFQLISDVPSFMHAIHLLLQRTPMLTLFRKYILSNHINWSLSADSPDWYEYDGDEWDGSPNPPLRLRFIQAGSRLGWSWCTRFYANVESCEINWLDPEPSRDSDEYEIYIEELQRIERDIDFVLYRGYHQPPSEEEYRRILEQID